MRLGAFVLFVACIVSACSSSSSSSSAPYPRAADYASTCARNEDCVLVTHQNCDTSCPDVDSVLASRRADYEAAFQRYRDACKETGPIPGCIPEAQHPEREVVALCRAGSCATAPKPIADAGSD